MSIEQSIEPSAEPVTDHYVEALQRFRGDVRMMEQVLATMIERGAPRTEVHLGLMLDEYLAGRSLRKARAIIEQLDALGVRIDPTRQYDVALATAASGSASEAIAIVDRLVGEQRDPAPAQASAVLDLMLGARRTPQAWSLFRRMRARDQHPSREALLTLLAEALQRRAAKDSVAVVRSLLAARHRLPDGRAGAVVRMLVALGQLDRAIEVLELVDAAADAGDTARPGDDVRGALLQALAAKGRVEDVLRLAARADEGTPSSGHLRNTVLAAHIAAGNLEAAWAQAEQMWADACLPTGANLEALLDVTLADGNVVRAAGVLDLLLVIGVPVSSQRSGAVLRAEMADGGLDRVLPVITTILDQGLVLDRAAARDLVERLVRARRLDEARAWLERLRRAGTLTQGRSYGSLLAALVGAKRVADAVALLEEMVAAGVRPEQADLARLVAGRVKSDDLASAERVLVAAASVGVHADESTLRELMWAHARRSDVAAVDRIIGLLVAAGIEPDERHEKARAWASGETPRRLDETAAPDEAVPPQSAEVPDESPSAPQAEQVVGPAAEAGSVADGS